MLFHRKLLSLITKLKLTIEQRNLSKLYRKVYRERKQWLPELKSQQLVNHERKKLSYITLHLKPLKRKTAMEKHQLNEKDDLVYARFL
jgi:hypothetical protein